MSIGILAYGSLIKCPGDEIKELLFAEQDRIPTPFPIEFAHESKERNGAPTLAPVESGGSCCEATILVLKENTDLDYAMDILYRREIGKGGNKDKHYDPLKLSPNKVYIEILYDAFGLDYVLYTKTKANIDPLTPDHLSDLAIESAKNEAGRKKEDGISYLNDVKRYGIHTALSHDYEQKILDKTNASNLEEAWRNARIT